MQNKMVLPETVWLLSNELKGFELTSSLGIAMNRAGALLSDTAPAGLEPLPPPQKDSWQSGPSSP